MPSTPPRVKPDIDVEDQSPPENISSSTRARARQGPAYGTDSVRAQPQEVFDTHRSPLVIAAVIAGGLAVAGVIVSKLRSSKQSRDASDQNIEDGRKTSGSAPPRGATAQTDRHGTRRKRSGYVKA